MPHSQKPLIALFSIIASWAPLYHTAHPEPASTMDLKLSAPVIDAYLADPCVYRSGEFYYLIATGKAPDGRWLPIYRSKDLTDWEFVAGAVERGEKGTWNRRNFWAPEVVEHEGEFYLYYTASPANTPENTGNRVGLATSVNPAGPFEDRGVIVHSPSLDGSPWQDDDGNWYLYYVVEHSDPDRKPGSIWVDRLTSMSEVAGEPQQVIHHHGWQEGPYMVRVGNTYCLTYSTGNWKSDGYQVRYAQGASAMGPFSEIEARPLLIGNDTVKGPGHHMCFEDHGSGDYYIVYHGWDPEMTRRYPRINRMTFQTDGTPVLGEPLIPFSR